MQSKRDLELKEKANFSVEVCERCAEQIPYEELSSLDDYCGDCRNRISGE